MSRLYDPVSMSLQEIFDAATRHLLTQNERAVDSGGRCVYRAPDGKMCVAGIFLTDEQADIVGTIWSVAERIGWTFDPKMSAKVRLLVQLQIIHDVVDPAAWPGELLALARRLDIVASPELLAHLESK